MWESPLAAIQLLWVNLIMDSLAALALATEDPKPHLLERPPYRKNEYIISQRMVKHILGQSLFQAFILFFFVFGAHTFIPESIEGYTNTDPSLGLTKDCLATHGIPEYKTYGIGKSKTPAEPYYVMNGMVQGF
jgi:magnesium-transporting ATPase (P-type)